MQKEIEDVLSESILQTGHVPPVVPFAGRLHRSFGTTAEPDEHPLSVEPKAWAGPFDSDRVRTDHYPTDVRRLLAPGDGTRRYPEPPKAYQIRQSCPYLRKNLYLAQAVHGLTELVGPGFVASH